MKPVRVLSQSLELLSEIDDYESLIFTRRWHTFGSFELHINRHKNNTGTLQKGNLIILGSDQRKVGIIKHREIGLDQSGKLSETWIIKGYTLSAIVGQRITVPPAGQAYDNITAPAESVMRHYVNANIVNPADVARKINQTVLAADQGRGATQSWQSRYKNLAEELEAISWASGLGWEVYLDLAQKKMVFGVREGRDITAENGVNPPVIFSPDFDSLESQHFADSDFNYKNVGYVAGLGEGELREIAEVGSSTGINRIETFIDARDIDDPINLPMRGEQKLAEVQSEKLLEAQILTHGPFKYQVDYDLGDTVTIQNRDWGVTLDARIIEIKETYEPDGFRLDAVFGNKWPTLVDKLKQELGQVSAEVRR